MRGEILSRFFVTRLSIIGLLAIFMTACAVATPPPPTAGVPAPPPRQGILPEAFESEEFVVTFAKAGDTTQGLAARFLGDPRRSWMIEEYNGIAALSPGQEVVIPKRPWNPAGVDPSGYQLVPILVYHNLGPQAKGRLVLSTKSFEEQMRYLKAQGYRVVSLNDFNEFISLKRQLPRKTVVLTFDDGYKAFLQYAYPVLKELGFTATLFVYTDYVGAGRNALNWDELRRLDAEGFQVEAHSKSHNDLRRAPGESESDYARRLKAELAEPLALFRRHLGRSPQILAYPYGGHDDDMVPKVREAGYIAAFTVRRQGNSSFVHPIKINRSQIYSEMSLDDFIRNLNVFNQEPIK